MIKKAFFFFLISIISISTFSQQDLYLGGEILGGTFGSAKLKNGILDKKNYSPTLGAQLNVNFRLLDVFSLEAGIGQHRNRIKLHDSDLEKDLDGFSVDINNTNLYWNYYGAVSAFYKIGTTDTYVYGKFALSVNTFKEGSITQEETFEISSQNISKTLVFTSEYEGSNISYIPEIGLQHKFFKGNLLSVGFRYNMGQSKMLKSDYTVRDNYTQETKSDELESVGNAFALSIRFDYKLIHFAKREKVKKLKLDDLAIDVSKKKETKVDSVQDEVKLDTAQPVSLANRDLIIKDRVNVHSSRVKIAIWDHQTVDGDRVSLNLNGKWILENYELKKQPFELEVDLREGKNTFVLHALNLGTYEPNTAALHVIEGDKKHRIILESNMNESGTLEINYKKKKNDSK